MRLWITCGKFTVVFTEKNSVNSKFLIYKNLEFTEFMYSAFRVVYNLWKILIFAQKSNDTVFHVKQL